MILNIPSFDEAVLRQETKEVTFPLTSGQEQLIFNMTETVIKKQGYALTAIQVDRPERIVVFDTGVVFINPVITRKWGKETHHSEECLSLPGVSVMVPRCKFIKVDYYDEKGILHSNQKFHKQKARTIQHEVDHLLNVIISDYSRRGR